MSEKRNGKRKNTTLDQAYVAFEAILRSSSANKFTGTIKVEMVLRDGGIGNMYVDKRETVI